MINIMTDPELRVYQESDGRIPLMFDVALPLATLPHIAGSSSAPNLITPKGLKSTKKSAV